MSTHPFIPLYVDDYDAHTAHLTPAQDGIYGRLLRLAWRTPGCSLPNDEAWIARKVRLSPTEWQRIGKPVLDEFFRLQRGRLVQKRLKAEYDDISRKKAARKVAGKMGGEAKARKTKGNGTSNATLLLAHTRASPEPEPEDKPPTPPEGGDMPSKFDDGWNAYPIGGRGNRGPAKARAEWPGAAERAGGETRLISAIKAHAQRLASDPQTPKAFDRWLRDDGFAAYLPAPEAATKRWGGPPEVWDAVAAARSPSFANTWLADCGFEEAPVRAVVSRSPTTISRLRQEVGPVLSDMGIQLREVAA